MSVHRRHLPGRSAAFALVPPGDQPDALPGQHPATRSAVVRRTGLRQDSLRSSAPVSGCSGRPRRLPAAAGPESVEDGAEAGFEVLGGVALAEFIGSLDDLGRRLITDRNGDEPSHHRGYRGTVRVVIAEDLFLLREGMASPTCSRTGCSPTSSSPTRCARWRAAEQSWTPRSSRKLLARRSSLPPVTRLTDREIQVLALMAEGRSNSAIAQRLVVSEKAVSKHCTSIFAKLDLPPSDDDNRRVLAVLAYLDS
jgi:DNA-binding CsgD family transcriptional regulator